MRHKFSGNTDAIKSKLGALVHACSYLLSYEVFMAIAVACVALYLLNNMTHQAVHKTYNHELAEFSRMHQSDAETDQTKLTVTRAPKASGEHGIQSKPLAHSVSNPNPLATYSHHDALVSAKTMVWRNIVVHDGDNLSDIFHRAGLSQQQMLKVVRLPEAQALVDRMRPNARVRMLVDSSHQLQHMTYPISETKTLIVDRAGEQFKGNILNTPFETKVMHLSGVIHHSLAKSFKQTGLSNKHFAQVQKIFADKVNFKRDIREGDRFDILYKTRIIKDKMSENGEILAARLLLHNKEVFAIEFIDNWGHAHYYDEDGSSLVRSYDRYPLKFDHVSSKFNLHRMHPILHKRRPHEGVDLAARSGTPVHATSSGRIKFSGRKGGYGRTVIIKNSRTVTTRYAHMSKIARGIKRGARVKRGQVIGYVGSSGMATGPHLHYEFRINGKPYDPLKVKLPKARPLPRPYRNEFLKVSGKRIEVLSEAI